MCALYELCSFTMNLVCQNQFMSSTLYMQMDELACFAPGMIALGASGYDPDNSKKFLALAEEVIMSDRIF